MTAKTRPYYVNLGKEDAQANRPRDAKFSKSSWQAFAYNEGYSDVELSRAKMTPPAILKSNSPLETYKAQVARLKAKGVKLVAMSCPKCTKIIRTLPAPKGETWDSVGQCPYCESIFLKITKGRNAYGVYRPEPGRVY